VTRIEITKEVNGFVYGIIYLKTRIPEVSYGNNISHINSIIEITTKNTRLE
jgi:hypothetical protein